MKITKDQFNKYLAVQRGGVVNMFNLKVVMHLTELTREQVIYIQKHYDELYDKYTKNN